MREVREAANGGGAVVDPLAQSGDSWERLLIELRRAAVADTLSTLDAVWRDEEPSLAA